MTLPLTTAPETICILRLSAVGDVCHLLPVVRTLQYHWPQTRLTWIIGKAENDLVGDIAGIEFIVFDKAEGLAAYRRLRLHRRVTRVSGKGRPPRVGEDRFGRGFR